MNKPVEILDETDVMPGTAIANVDQSLAIGLTRAEIDQQIATARAYPRSLKQVAARVLSMATLDEESAEECLYALPRGGKPIKGPSIRFAEILTQSYGNCRVAARVVHVDRAEKYVEAEGVFHDLETNAARSSRVRRRISDKHGKLFTDDMILVTGNAACSIAIRNAILAGVPKPLWRRAYEQVQLTVAGDITTLSENRGKAIKAFAHYGLKPEQIFRALGVVGEEDITVDHITVLRGMFAALKNGEATVEEMFSGTVPGKSAHEKVVNPLSDDEPAKAETADPVTGEIMDAPEATGKPAGAPEPASRALTVGVTQAAPSEPARGGKAHPDIPSGQEARDAAVRELAAAGQGSNPSLPSPQAVPAGSIVASSQRNPTGRGEGLKPPASVGSTPTAGTTDHGPVAQQAERPAFNREVANSTLAGATSPLAGGVATTSGTTEITNAMTETASARQSPAADAAGGEPSASPAIGFPPTIPDEPMNAADLAADFHEKLSMGVTVKAISSTYVTMYKDRIEALPIEDRKDFNPIYHAHNKRVTEGWDIEECRAICDAAIERIRARQEHVGDLLGGISA